MKTTIPAAPPEANPNAGARTMAGKTNGPEAVLLGNDPGTRPASAVKNADCKEGLVRKCIDNQVGQNGNPKKRDASHWGTGQDADDDEDFLNEEHD